MSGSAPFVSAPARRYARALMAAAQAQGALAAVAADLQRIGQLVAARELAATLADPRVDEALKQRRMEELCGPGTHALSRSLLRVLGKRQRNALLLELPAAFGELLDRLQGRARGVVEAARPLDAQRLRRLEQALGARTGKQVSLEARHEPSLLGGVRVTLDGIRYDGSARGRLEQMRRQLAAAELAPR